MTRKETDTRPRDRTRQPILQQLNMPPRKKLTKEEKEKLKREEEERRRIEEEEQRQREEEERLLREEEERKEREERARLKAIEDARFLEETEALSSMLAAHTRTLNEWRTDKKEKTKWQRYLDCDPLPEPEEEAAVSTFLTLWEMDNDWMSVDSLFEGIQVAEKFREKVMSFLESDGSVPVKTRKDLLKSLQRLDGLLEDKIHKFTGEVFKCDEDYMDSETGNLCLQKKVSDYILCIWGNIAKNPRVKSFVFSETEVTVDIPKPLLLADIVVRLQIPSSDPFSQLCRTYKSRSRPPSQDVVEEEEEELEQVDKEGTNEDNQEVVQEENPPEQELKDEKQLGSEDLSASINSTLKEESSEKNTENKPSQDEEGGESDPVPSGGPEDTPLSPEVPEEDGVLLEEGEVDMRAMMVIGRLMRFDLLRLPPQPKTTGQWTMKQVLQDGLPVYPYPADPRSAQQQQKEENNKPPGSQPPQTPGGASGPPVKITARLPEEFILPSDPTVARWDHHHSHWTTNSVLGVDVNHEEGTFTCQVPTCCPLALMIDTHWNMPYQRWELMPVEENGCLLTVTGAHMEVKINIKNDQCCLLPQPVSQQDEDEEERKEAPLNKLSNKWMSNRELMKGLLSYGVNIFPSEDAVKYVDTPNKSWSTEDGVYLHMALLSNVYAFARSRWNTSVPRHQFVMKVTEMAGEKKSNEPQWSLVIGGRRSCRLQMKEEDDQFSPDMVEGCEVHPDLYNALTHDGSPGLSDLLSTTPPVHVNSVQTWLAATRVLRFS